MSRVVRLPTARGRFALLSVDTSAQQATAREAMRAAGIDSLPVLTFARVGTQTAELRPTGETFEAAG